MIEHRTRTLPNTFTTHTTATTATTSTTADLNHIIRSVVVVIVIGSGSGSVGWNGSILFGWQWSRHRYDRSSQIHTTFIHTHHTRTMKQPIEPHTTPHDTVG